MQTQVFIARYPDLLLPILEEDLILRKAWYSEIKYYRARENLM